MPGGMGAFQKLKLSSFFKSGSFWAKHVKVRGTEGMIIWPYEKKNSRKKLDDLDMNGGSYQFDIQGISRRGTWKRPRLYAVTQLVTHPVWKELAFGLRNRRMIAPFFCWIYINGNDVGETSGLGRGRGEWKIVRTVLMWQIRRHGSRLSFSSVAGRRFFLSLLSISVIFFRRISGLIWRTAAGLPTFKTSLCKDECGIKLFLLFFSILLVLLFGS